MGKKETEATKRQDDDNALVFQWKSKSKIIFHLTVFTIVSLAIHGFGFYLFKVVYPTSGQIEPKPERIMLLDDSDPAVHALLSKVNDRVVFLKPASDGADIRASLNDYSIRFSPAYSDRSGSVKATFPARELGLDPPEEDELFLPPIPKPDEK